MYDNLDLIEILDVDDSEFEYRTGSPFDTKFPCNLCEHQDKDEDSEPCVSCGHIN